MTLKTSKVSLLTMNIILFKMFVMLTKNQFILSLRLKKKCILKFTYFAEELHKKCIPRFGLIVCTQKIHFSVHILLLSIIFWSTLRTPICNFVHEAFFFLWMVHWSINYISFSSITKWFARNSIMKQRIAEIQKKNVQNYHKKWFGVNCSLTFETAYFCSMCNVSIWTQYAHICVYSISKLYYLRMLQ